MDRETKTQPRLILFTPVIGAVENFSELLGPVCAAADVAAVILRTGTVSNENIIASARHLAPKVQDIGVALLLEGHPSLAAEANADGTHAAGLDALRSALPLMKPARIAGVGMLTTRHDAMTAGEAGADYVMFGEIEATGKRPGFDTIVDRVAWWAEIFEVPCAGFAANIEEVAALSGAGADFIAVGDALWNAAGEPAEAVRKIAAQLRAESVA